jgi:Tripartite tricarboxylate transporter TctB family.
MRKWDRVSAILLAVLGVAAIYEAIDGIGIGTFSEPGSGFYPFLLAIALVALSAILFFTRLGGNEQPIPFWGKGAWRKPCLAIAVLAGFFIMVLYVGFIVGTVYMFFAWMMIVEKESFKKSAIVAFAIAGIVYVVFVICMKIPLPSGLLI